MHKYILTDFLGLFISRQITEMMGGQIGVSHDQKEGCTFAFFVKTCKVPMNEVDLAINRGEIASTVSLDPSIASVESIPHETIPDGSSTPRRDQSKILVVEDNVINQRVLCKQLRNHGFSVVAANNGEEALAALKAAAWSPAKYFDIVLCDIEMPIMGGIECITEIRRLEALKRLPGPIPAIAVTANARNEHVKSALQAGMTDVTTKPYRMNELISQIERYILDSDVLASGRKLASTLLLATRPAPGTENSQAS
jgi:CheY-like chemotaxis protein